ncbi:PREDICTED: uncharacterized protein LOC105556709 [Vollenhovia emeryi]|uniref:uncharacterized protein LOC105556709 n=1 Tax=Vollenhovia emeryi TaxID=411798 RepID=UPI0005F47803|nr:PREDICTED: uncharacterized protein LOC105556709 [Vollenhovia emeryi]
MSKSTTVNVQATLPSCPSNLDLNSGQSNILNDHTINNASGFSQKTIQNEERNDPLRIDDSEGECSNLNETSIILQDNVLPVRNLEDIINVKGIIFAYYLH